MTVQPIDGWRFFVKGGKMDCVVNLEHGKCDCGVYAMEKIPCSHAIAAGTSDGLHIFTLVCPVYSKDFMFAGYSENIYPCVGQQVEEYTFFPPDVKHEDLQVSHPVFSLPEDLQVSRLEGRPEGRPVSRSVFILLEDLQWRNTLLSCLPAGTSTGLHISTLVCPVYSKDFMFAVYSENIYPCVGQQVEEHTCFPPDVKRGPGRQKKSRWQS
ncbi:hypothetical protein F2Q68_00021882 [Brassica cretica]|uniref:SWIM-type domain-containing protein n=1 Tax=Brassica cretica TaxID=69181 RepID=A0A8S9FU10_BRACR|nr:hypothetical protein F2Q68_00021882 [Brassica cretica]